MIEKTGLNTANPITDLRYFSDKKAGIIMAYRSMNTSA